MSDRLLSLLGLCRRAGRLTIGCDPVKESVTKGEAQLVLFAKDASANTLKDVASVAEKAGVKTVTIAYDKKEISASVGKLCAVAGVNDGGFAKKILELSGKDNGEECDLC